MAFFVILNLLSEFRIGLPLAFDDQEEDAGGDAEDDGEHRDDSRKDDIVKEHRGGRASVDFHLVQD